MLLLSIVTVPTENGQKQKHLVTRKGPQHTDVVSDRGNATKQKSGAATTEERVAKEKAALAASKEARTISDNAAIEMVKRFNESKFLSTESWSRWKYICICPGVY